MKDKQETEYFANWLTGGKNSPEPYKSKDKDYLLKKVVETAQANRKAENFAFFSMWHFDDEGWFTIDIKGCVNDKGGILFQTEDDRGKQIVLQSKTYLNGKEYKGSVYFLDARGNDDKGAGNLYAFCYGKTWGVDTATCLAPLKDSKGNYISFPEYRGASARIDNNIITLEKYDQKL